MMIALLARNNGGGSSSRVAAALTMTDRRQLDTRSGISPSIGSRLTTTTTIRHNNPSAEPKKKNRQRRCLSMMATDSRELRFFGASSSSSDFFAAPSSNGSSIRNAQSKQQQQEQQQHKYFQHPFVAFVSSVATASSASTAATAAATTITQTKAKAKSASATVEREAASASSGVATTARNEPLLVRHDEFRATAAALRFSMTNGAQTHSSNRYEGLGQRFFFFRNWSSGSAASSSPSSSSSLNDSSSSSSPRKSPRPEEATADRPPQKGYGTCIRLTDEEKKLFALLRHVRAETGLENTTLRVAGGWVRDKLLATDEFQAYHKVFVVAGKRLTSKFQIKKQSPPQSSMGRQGTKILVNPDDNSQPVDIDIALDDMLGREFADHLNEYLSMHGKDTLSVGVVLKNPEKSKHLETATMKVGPFWIDFVNLRAEEYTQDSRIPDLMRIGTASEDAFRRDLTINALFYNINTGEVEDWTGRGFDDLRKGIVATPLPPLTTLLDDPLRVLRSIRFAARLRFTMDEELVDAALDDRVRSALAQKVSRERVGGEVDLMLRSPDPVGAVRLLVNLNLAGTVFPIEKYIDFSDAAATTDGNTKRSDSMDGESQGSSVGDSSVPTPRSFFEKGLELLSMSHDHLVDCRLSPPVWCMKPRPIYGAEEMRLTEDGEARRLLWYASFLKPMYDYEKRQQLTPKASRRQGKRANRSLIKKLLVDELKRPVRDAESVERIIKAANEFTRLLNSGFDISAMMILLSDVRVMYHGTGSSSGGGGRTTTTTASTAVNGDLSSGAAFAGKDSSSAGNRDGDDNGVLSCAMNGRAVDSANEEDPVWEHAMEFRLLCSKVLHRIGPLWRAALFLSIAEQLSSLGSDTGALEYAIEGDVVDESQEEQRRGVVERFDAFATALQQVGLIGIWNEKPLLDGGAMKEVLPSIPKGPAFRDVMDEQECWMTTHPGAGADELSQHLKKVFVEYRRKSEKNLGKQQQKAPKKKG